MDDYRPYKPKIDPRYFLGLFVACIGLICSFGVYIFSCYRANQYDHAPACGGNQIDPSLPGCSYADYQIDGQSLYRTSYGRRSWNQENYRIQISNAGDSRRVDAVDFDFWESVGSHDKVRVQMWNGDPTMLYDRGMQSQTTKNPDYSKSFYLHFLENFGGICAVAIVVVFLSPYIKRTGSSTADDWSNLKGD